MYIAKTAVFGHRKIAKNLLVKIKFIATEMFVHFFLLLGYTCSSGQTGSATEVKCSGGCFSLLKDGV